MDLSIIIVNWNSREYLRKCMTSISSHAPRLDYEVIVIDSGSFDGCEEMLKEHFPAVRFVQHERNDGFAKANNIAFGASAGASLLFLNPDTEVVGPAIEVLYKSLHSLPDAGIVGARLVNTDGSLQSSCIQALPTIL